MKRLYDVDMGQTQRSKLIEDIPQHDVVILMGCPSVSGGIIENWGFDDPTGKADKLFEDTNRRIEENIRGQKERLL